VQNGRLRKGEGWDSHTIRNKRMKAFLSASPCIFFENETLFHEGENSWAGREKSSHFSILKEKNTLSSPTLLRLFWNFVYVQISVFPLSPSWVRDSLLGKEGGINTYGGVGGGGVFCLFSPSHLPAVSCFSCPHPRGMSRRVGG
jgi:hypothetical protein